MPAIPPRGRLGLRAGTRGGAQVPVHAAGAPPVQSGAAVAGLASGALSTVGSDHAPFMHADKLGQADFTQVPQGAAGIETRLPLTYHHGVVAGRFSRRRMVDTLAEAPARLFGLYPRKGVVQPGSDADVVVLDPEARTTLTAGRLHSRSDYTIFEGMEIEGAVRDVLVRGRSVVTGGELVADPPPGRFLERDRPPAVLP